MPGLCEELKLFLKINFGALIVVYSLNALNSLVVVFLYQMLRANFTDVVQTRGANASDVLLKILPQAMDQPLHVIGLPQSAHTLKP